MSAGYYDTSYPPSLWEAVATPSTGATAGIPGSWTPAGSQPPATVADLQGGIPNVVTANPATGWAVGRYVQTRTAGGAGEATWTGSGWVGGRAPSAATRTAAKAPVVPQDERKATGGIGTAPKAPRATEGTESVDDPKGTE